MQGFLDALDARVLVCDGAMGTMLYGKGIFLNRCFDELNLTQPDLVAEVHRDYVRAGADVLETNTFGANRFKLANFGWRTRPALINVQGARIARHAARDAAWVAGVDGSARRAHRALGPHRVGEAEDAFREQAASLAGRRRRSVHAGDVPRPERTGRGRARRAQRVRAADRRADDDRGGRQQSRRHAAGDVRAGARARGRRCDWRQLLGGAGRDARDARGDRADHRSARCPRSRMPAGRATSKGAISTSVRPTTWRSTRGGSLPRARDWSAAAAARRRTTSGRSRMAVRTMAPRGRSRARRPAAERPAPVGDGRPRGEVGAGARARRWEFAWWSKWPRRAGSTWSAAVGKRSGSAMLGASAVNVPDYPKSGARASALSLACAGAAGGVDAAALLLPRSQR